MSELDGNNLLFSRYRRTNFGQNLWPESPILLAYSQTQNCTKGEVLTHEDMGYNNFDRCTVSFRGEEIGATCCHPEIAVGMAVSIVERPRGKFWATVFQNSWYARPLAEVAAKGKPYTAALEYLLSKGPKWRPDLILFDKDWGQVEYEDDGGETGGTYTTLNDGWDYAANGEPYITLPRWLSYDWPECIFHEFDADSDGRVYKSEWAAKMPKEKVEHTAGSICRVTANPTFGGATFSAFARRYPTGTRVDLVFPDGGDAMTGYHKTVTPSDFLAGQPLLSLYFIGPAACPALEFLTSVYITAHIPHF
jgi:hypothetical protein